MKAQCGFWLPFILLYLNSITVHAVTDGIQEKNLKTHLLFLSSPALQGRMTGSPGEKDATQYAADIFQHLGLEPAGENGTFFQEFYFRPLSKSKNAEQQGRNVLARLRVGHSTAPMLIIGAHADHLGHGEYPGSRAKEHIIHPGADDNASGVASVLAAAARLTNLKKQGKLQGNRDILFAIWSGEELGLLGSSHFIKHFAQKTRKKSLHNVADAYINLDMVGRLRKKLILQGVDSSSDWPTLIKQTNKNHNISLVMQNDSYLPTDSTSFYLHGIPALNFFTGAHNEYHTPRDTYATLNLMGIKKITYFLVDLTLVLEKENRLIHYQKIKSHKHAVRGFKMYLGTIPDYANDNIIGVKLAGVAKDSPSDRAMLQENDIIIALAGKKIRDIYDYALVLNKLRANQPVIVLIQRGTKKLALTIVPQLRKRKV